MAKTARMTSNGIRANYAGTSGVKHQAKGLGKWGWALVAASMALAFIPVAGGALSHIVDRFRSSSEAKDKKKTLTKWYRNQIAAQLQIAPEKVTYKDLELAAQLNPTFGKMISKIEDEQSKENKSSLIGAGIATFVPGIGGGFKGAGIMMGASMTPYLFGDKEMPIDEVANHINEKRQNGQPIEAGDIFMLRLAHDTELQEKIAKEHGARFQKMNGSQQQALMNTMPNMMQAAEREAYALNKGLISEQDLILATNTSPGKSFAASLQPKPDQASFRAREESRRRAAANLQQSLA
jgi:hypothetical protein